MSEWGGVKRKHRIANQPGCLLLIVFLVAAFIAYQAGGGRRSSPKKIRTVRTLGAAVKRRPPKPRPAILTVMVVDATTAQVMPAVPVAVAKTYVTTDASGSVTVSGLKSGDVTISARSIKHRLYEQKHKLMVGDNTFTVTLQPDTETISPNKVVYQRKAYLTIDDGPSATWTPEVLDILKRERVPATFFLVGRRTIKHPEIVRRIYLEGHTIGNHTYSHNYEEIYRGSPRNLTASFAKNGQLLKTIIGYAPAITRPPGGAASNFRAGWQSWVTGAGYTTVLWNVSTGDGSTQTTSPQMVANAKRYLDRLISPKPAVILMHDVRPPIIKALPEIIAEVRRRGFEFSVITDDLREPGLILGPWRRPL